MLPLKLSPLYRLCESISMHTIDVKVLNGDFSVCHPFRHLEMTNVDMVGPLGSGPISLHECYAAKVVLVNNCMTKGVSLFLHKFLDVDSPSR